MKNSFGMVKVFSLEHQAFVPVTNPIEMKSTWQHVEQKLQESSEYPNFSMLLSEHSTIDSTLVTKAIAQFERTLISPIQNSINSF